MSPKHDTRSSTTSVAVAADAKTMKTLSKSTKRRRSKYDPGADDAPSLSTSATVPATLEPLPSKRRRRDPALIAEDKVEKKRKDEESIASRAAREEERAKKRDEEEVEKKRKREGRAALKVAKEKEREEKMAREAAEKKRKQVDRVAKKVAKNKEKEEQKKLKEAKKKEKQEQAAAQQAVKNAEAAAKAQKKRWKREWEEYCSRHNVDGATVAWPADKEPLTITQSDAGKLYTLKPNEMLCLKHQPRINPYHGNMMKLFDENEVKKLAFRKYAMLAGVLCGETAKDEDAMIARGKELWLDEGRHGPGKTIWSPGGAHSTDLDHDDNVNWWRDPRALRKMGYENGKLRTTPVGSDT